MNARSIGTTLFFYLGLALVFMPFLRQNTLYLPFFFLAAWGVRKMALVGEHNPVFSTVREKIDRFFIERKRPVVALLLAAAVAVPFVSTNYLIDIFTSAILYAILATALNITVGMTGVLVLGFIGFYAIGAYTTGILTAKFHLCGFWTALPLSGLIAMLFGLLLGIPTLRLKGDYLAIVTLGFGEIVKIFLNNLDRFTGGPNGIMGIKKPVLFGWGIDTLPFFYWFCLLCLAGEIVIVARIFASRYGRAWVAVRENEMAASALGIDVFRRHLLSFSLSAFFGGCAGSLFAVKQGFISPDSFTFLESVMVLCMVVLGGIGTIAGAVAGAFLLVVVPEFLREFALYRMLIFGAVMIAFMIYHPHGLFGSRTISLEQEDRLDGGE
jgi:branched-chain amino acid transport system permease protein